MRIRYQVMTLIVWVVGFGLLPSTRAHAQQKTPTNSQGYVNPGNSNTTAPKPVTAGSNLADSEYFWQAYEDEFILYPRFEYHYLVNNQTDAALNNFSLGGSTYYGVLQAEYGIADLIAIGIKTGYGSGVAQLSLSNPANYYYGNGQIASIQTTNQGMDNIDFYTKARYRITRRGTAYAGINFNWSPDSHRISDIQGDSNLFTGGNTFSGHIGAEYSVKKFIFGLNFNADFYKSSLTTINFYGIQLNSSGGLSRTFTAFGELVGKGFQTGLAFNYISNDQSILSQPNTVNQNYDATTLIALKAYGALSLTDSINILPSFTYDSLINKTLNGRNVSQNYDMIAALGLRFSL